MTFKVSKKTHLNRFAYGDEAMDIMNNHLNITKHYKLFRFFNKSTKRRGIILIVIN